MVGKYNQTVGIGEKLQKKNCLLMIGSHHECYKSMKSCHYIGPTYIPHPEISCVDFAAHALIQYKQGSPGHKIAMHDLNTYCHRNVNDHHCNKIQNACSARGMCSREL